MFLLKGYRSSSNKLKSCAKNPCKNLSGWLIFFGIMPKDKVIILVIVSLLVGFVVGAVAGIKFSSGDLHAVKTETAPQSAPAKIPSEEETKALEGVLEKDPNNLQAIISLGNRYFDLHQYRKAIDLYSRALKIDPKNADVRTDMAIMYRGLKEYDTAVKELRQAAAQNPGHVNSRYNLGIILLHDKKDIPGAVAAWEDCLKAGATGEQAEVIRGQLKELKDLSG
jgi:cytochrome c-type biogenesis protein CcmH/NrfG